MRLRVLITLLCVLCLGTAAVFGVLHDHHDANAPGEHHNCQACTLQLTGNAVAPVIVCAPVVTLSFDAVRQPVVVVPEFILLPLAASRAPPETSA
jgi:hypothetical protein